MEPSSCRTHLLAGQVIPAMPLALNPDGTWSEAYQRTLVRYYLDSGAGGLAVGVHSTQFEIREPKHSLYDPVLQLCSEEIESWLRNQRTFIKVAGICGPTDQALAEAEIALSHGYDAGLVSMTALKDLPHEKILAHCKEIASRIPIIGFYLQPAIGGGVFPYSFWRRFVEIGNVVAIKVSPFDRYATLDVIRAVIDAERNDIALYTGNDDNIIVDLLTPFEINGQTRHIVGGLLGQWAVWTRRAVEMLQEIKEERTQSSMDPEWLTLNAQLTDANAAIFDPEHEFAGCIPGILEVLHRQGLVPSTRCLNPDEHLSAGQAEELDRVLKAYPHLQDEEFVRKNRERWLS